MREKVSKVMAVMATRTGRTLTRITMVMVGTEAFSMRMAVMGTKSV